ncbi:MAG: gliding motility-associated C-terminal domain-containing protein [Saprospiraceae bacterium]|nr:gliding motility-associated C-terminal domain-containing protein [Saprospiraceae bacterium]
MLYPMLKLYFIRLLLFVLPMTGWSQYCDFDAKHRGLLESSQDYRKKTEEMEKAIHRYSLDYYQNRVQPRSRPSYTLPVVVHLIVPPGTAIGQGNNLSDRQVEQGLDYLNQAFANAGPFAAANGSDIGIQFCLARRDPSGLPTNGITRTPSNLVNDPMCLPGTNAASDAALKALVGWDCSRYINIYLVTDLFNNNFGCSLAGYAYFPGAPCTVDGIVQESRYWNSIGGTVVTAHEMGHFFSLNHTFNGGCTNNNCLLDGDRVCDTPPDNSASFAPCNTNSCATDAPDLPDDNTNYMDYSSCAPVHFTDGQRVRMIAALETTRKSLIASNGCLPPGDYDATALDLVFIHSVCTDTLCLQLNMRNDGIRPFSSIRIDYQIDGIPQTPYIWNGNLNPTQSASVLLPCLPINPGNHKVDLQLGQPDNQNDFYPQNNNLSISFDIFDELKLTIDSLQPTHCISDGKLWAHATGGGGSYIYRLDKRAGSQTDPYFQLLLSGNYTLFAEDANGCQTSIPVVIPDSCAGIGNKKFITNGNARQLGNDCYLLTEERYFQSGSIWYEDKVSLHQSFDIYFDLSLGCLDGPGADGIAFVFQPISTSIGVAGGGLGYQGIVPSLAVEFDSYQNGNYNDPPYDHMAVMRNGNVDHGSADNLAGPTGILNGNANAEDCMFHKVLIRWSASNATLEVYVDCNLKLRYSGNIVSTIFNSDPNVFFGFTAATGSAINVQQICLNYISGITTLPDLTICDGEAIQVSAKPNFAKYSWSPSRGVSDTSIFNPVIQPDTTTTYRIRYQDACGFSYEDSMTIFVKKYKLQYELQLSDSCGSFRGALLRVLEKPEDSAALYSSDGIYFYKQLYFEIPEEGFYTIYTKIGNCILPELIEVTAYQHRLRDSLIRVQAMNCIDSGRIVITALEGIPPYAYRINGGAWQNDGIFSGLIPGNYLVEIKDATSCGVSRAVDVGLFRPQLQLNLDSAQLEISCCRPHAFIAVSADGSFPFYYYSLDQSSWEQSDYFNNLNPGPHILITRDEFGCSSDTLHFDVIDRSATQRDTQIFKICSGEFVEVGNNRYTTTGTYVDVFQNLYCCDSSVVTMLTVEPVYDISNPKRICRGDSIAVGSKFYKSSGNYRDTLQSIHSCDSIIQTSLVVDPVYDMKLQPVICDGDSVFVGNHVYTSSGVYIDSLQTRLGCDSIIRSELTVNPRNQYVQNIQLCKGQFVRVGNKQYNSTGLYTDLLQNRFGCDSLIETRLLVDTVDVSIQLDTIKCFGDDDATLRVAPVSGIPGFRYALDDTTSYQSNNTFSPLTPGNYQLFVQDTLGCENKYSVVVFDPQQLQADLPVEIKLTLGDKTQLLPLLNFIPASALWTPADGLSCTDCVAPYLQALQNATYEVILTNSAGCEVRTSIKIIVDNQTDVYVPNVFSPNGDQINDVVTVFGGASIREIAIFRIYNRWGNLVFENRNFPVNQLQYGWDGRWKGEHMNPAVFVYYLKAVRLDGTVLEKSGDVSLVR